MTCRTGQMSVSAVSTFLKPNQREASQSCFCLWRHKRAFYLSWVQLSWVELCRYKHPLRLRDRCVDVNETKHVYSTGRGQNFWGFWISTPALRGATPELSPVGSDDPPRAGYLLSYPLTVRQTDRQKQQSNITSFGNVINSHCNWLMQSELYILR